MAQVAVGKRPGFVDYKDYIQSAGVETVAAVAVAAAAVEPVAHMGCQILFVVHQNQLAGFRIHSSHTHFGSRSVGFGNQWVENTCCS